jgi:hypothetical protein
LPEKREKMTNVTAQYTSPTYSLNIAHPVSDPGGSQKASLEALRQAVLSIQTDLNVFLTERKLEEDRANGVDSVSSKRKFKGDEEEGDGDEDENGEDE